MSRMEKAAMYFDVQPLEPRQFLSKTIYVDLNAPGPSHDGATWNSAYVSLQQGLAVAQSGDEIRVADGTYTPGPNDTDTFSLKNGLAMRGGYAGSGAPNPDARDVVNTPSILTGSNTSLNGLGIVTGTGSSIGMATLVDGFKFISQSGGFGVLNNGASPTISNCTFTGGTAIQNGNGSQALIQHCQFVDGEGSGDGAMVNVNSSPTITDSSFVHYHGAYAGAMANLNSTVVVRNCTFDRCTAVHRGNAVWDHNSTATFSGCSFTHNGDSHSESAAIEHEGTLPLTVTGCTFSDNFNNFAGGAAIIDSGGTLDLSASTFTRNRGPYDGGALSLTGPATISGCIFNGNTALMSGGAIYSTAGLTLLNSTFSGNASLRSDGGGGAIAGDGTIINCTFSSNTTGGDGGAIEVSGGGLDLRNSILWSDSAAADGKEIYVSPYGSVTLSFDHNLIAAPNVANPSFLRNPDPGADQQWGTADDDYGDLRLQSYSPAVDAGNNSALPAGTTTDLAGKPRVIDFPGVHDPGAIVDLGAYELQPPTTVTAASFDVDAPRPSIKVTFANDIDPSLLQPSDLTLYNVQNNEPVHGEDVTQVSYDPATRTATWAFIVIPPDGNYQARLRPAVLTDEYTLPLFFLAGDANRNHVVDVSDLGILATNWQGTGKNFSHGDFNYDGVVDVTDLGILASNWQHSLPMLPASASASASRATADIANDSIVQEILS